MLISSDCGGVRKGGDLTGGLVAAGRTGVVGERLTVLNPLTTLLTHVEGALSAINFLYDS